MAGVAKKDADMDVILTRDEATKELAPAGIVTWVTNQDSVVERALKEGKKVAKVGVAVMCENENIIYETFDLPISQLPNGSEGKAIAQHLASRIFYTDEILPTMQKRCEEAKAVDGFTSKAWYVFEAKRNVNQIHLPPELQMKHGVEQLFQMQTKITCMPDIVGQRKGANYPQVVPFSEQQISEIMEEEKAAGLDRPFLEVIMRGAALELSERANQVCKDSGAAGLVYGGPEHEGWVMPGQEPGKGKGE